MTERRDSRGFELPVDDWVSADLRFSDSDTYWLNRLREGVLARYGFVLTKAVTGPL